MADHTANTPRLNARVLGWAIHLLWALADWLTEPGPRSASLRPLLDLDDHMLRDIGIERGDAEWAVRQPSPHDAAVELMQISGRNARKG